MISAQNRQLQLNGNNQVPAKGGASQFPLNYKKLRDSLLSVIRHIEGNINIYQ